MKTEKSVSVELVKNTKKSGNSTAVVDVSKISPEEMVLVQEISKELNVSDPNSVLNYGVESQMKLSQYSSEVLKTVRNIDTGEIGEVIVDLLKDLNMVKLDSEKNFLTRQIEKIPILKNLVSTAQKVIVKYDKINNNLDNITLSMDKGRVSLLKDIDVLENMYDNNVEYIKELERYIIAAKLKIQEIEEEIANKGEVSDVYDELEIRELSEFVNRLDKKVVDLQLTRQITIQSLPQVKIVQGNNSLMVDKIQSTILNTVPMWRNHICLTLALDKQKRMINIQKGAKEATTKILLKNSTMLKENSIEIAKINEETIIDMETINKVNEDLVTTLDEILRIKEEGDINRKLVTEELTQVENEIKDRIIDIKKSFNKKQLNDKN